MDLISLLTGSENLYKYLFVGGLGLVILSLFYPLNKRYELECQKNLHNKEIRLLNLDIESLQHDVTKLNNRVDQYQNPANKITSGKLRKAIKDSIRSQYKDVLIKRKSISQKETEIQFNRDNIETLNDNIESITVYEKLFFWTGIVFSIMGFTGWLSLMFKKHTTSP